MIAKSHCTHIIRNRSWYAETLVPIAIKHWHHRGLNRAHSSILIVILVLMDVFLNENYINICQISI